MTTPSPVQESLPWENVRCNLCGADDFRVRFDEPIPAEVMNDLTDFLATTDHYGHYGRIVECRRCGLVYTNPRLRLDRIQRGYETTVDEEYVQEGASRSINAYFCLSTLMRAARSGRFLDIGCANGFLLNAARIHFETRGIEPSAWARRYVTERLGIPVDGATLAEARYPDARFDVVSMVDVIEHFADPAGELKEIARVLKPGGVLYLVTPDLSGLAARLMRGRWWALRPAHLYYYDRATLKAALEKAGFRIEFIGSYGKIFTYGYWLSRLKSYPKPLYRSVEALVNFFGVHDKLVYIDTRDSMQVLARRL